MQLIVRDALRVQTLVTIADVFSQGSAVVLTEQQLHFHAEPAS